ncbi:unnamed protein product [Schistosoma intercalatum]|nr:unnamed protein product [Schistosoma intercalatum]
MNKALRLSRLVLQSTDSSLKSSMVICHGLLGSKNNWKSISNALAQKNCGTIVAVDLRNHGNSPHSDDMNYFNMAEDIHMVVDDLSLRSVCLVGHSMGGKAVMCAALMKKDLMSSVDLKALGHKNNGNIGMVRNSLMKEWDKTVPNPTMRAFLLTNLGEKDGEIFWKVNLKAIKSCWNQITDFPAELSGRVFNQPVMFVAASDGKYLGRSDLPSVRKYFPQAKIVQIANTGHWVHFDAPNTVTNLITSFMLDKSFDPTSFADVKEIK